MGDILDVSGHKIAVIGDDGYVRTSKGVVLGHVAPNGDVYNVKGQRVGYFQENGHIYQGTRHIGTTHSDGWVSDYENQHVGKISGSHLQLGGAALLLLVR